MALRSLLLGGIFEEIFDAQTQSIDYDGSSEALRNTTEQALGIANLWSIGVWFKVEASGFSIPFAVNTTSGSPNRSLIAIQLDSDFSGSNQLRVLIFRSDGTASNDFKFDSFVTLDQWIHVLVVWTGSTPLKVYKNGVLQVADSSTSNSTVQTDTSRQIGVGNTLVPAPIAIDGKVSQVQIWRVDTSAAASFLNTNPSSINLNADSGVYTFSGDLAHWWRPGHEASPSLGKDFSTAGFTPTIDVETNAVGITDADRVADVPS